jgi:hemerythrin
MSLLAPQFLGAKESCMALLKWSQDYSVRVPSIDTQHQELFAMINELHQAMTTGKGSLLVPEIVKRLAAYTQWHFADEEAKMKLAKYPDFAGHKTEHEKLSGEVAKLVKDMSNGSQVVTMQLMEFLRDWLKAHIVQCDRRYSMYLQAAGIR